MKMEMGKIGIFVFQFCSKIKMGKAERIVLGLGNNCTFLLKNNS